MYLFDIFRWHLHVLAVSLVTHRLNELDAVVEVPVHEVPNLAADTHIRAVLLPAILPLEVAFQELAGDDDTFFLDTFIEPLCPGCEIPFVVEYRLLLAATLSQLHRKKKLRRRTTTGGWHSESKAHQDLYRQNLPRSSTCPTCSTSLRKQRLRGKPVLCL